MKASVNDYFRQNKVRILLFGLFTAFVSFLAPLKSFQLKWLIDSSSKNEAFAYLGLVFTITFASWLFELLSRRSFTKLACGAVEQVRNQVMECVLHRSVAQYNNESDAVYLSLLTTDLRTTYQRRSVRSIFRQNVRDRNRIRRYGRRRDDFGRVHGRPRNRYRFPSVFFL